MLSREQIFEILKYEYQVEITNRTFDYYRFEGLIPQIQGRKKGLGLYPDYTPELIFKIKSLQKEGFKLSEIKEFATWHIDMVRIDQEIDDYKTKNDFYQGWQIQQMREQRILSFLKIKRKQAKIDSATMLFSEREAFVYLAVFNPNDIKFYKILVSLYQPGNEKLIEKKKLNLSEYMAIVRALIKPVTENNHVLNKEDIFLAIFA